MTAFLIFLGVCAVLSLIYLFLVFPAIRRHEYRKNLKKPNLPFSISNLKPP